MVGPNFTDKYWLHGCQPKEIAASIIHGYPEKGMMPYGSGSKLKPEQVEYLISYIASLQGTHPENPKEVDMTRAKQCTDGPLAGLSDSDS
jgi:cytochrome c oxidase cbb3-type subunit 3